MPKGVDQAMYFISKGTCSVRVQAQAAKEPTVIRQLNENDHFGEIHLLYRCPRSATVISNNYNTLARLKYDNFKDLSSEFPEYEQALRKHVIKVYGDMNKPEKHIPGVQMTEIDKYRKAVDPRIQFLRETIGRVPYLSSIDDEVFFDIMFALASRNYEKEELVLTEENNAEALLFIDDGILEVYTHFEANEFILERLGRGTALNHRAYFMKDSMYVNIRCIKEAKVLSLPLERMKEIIARWPDKKFSTEMLYFQNRILKQEKKFSLDYIVKMPKSKVPDDVIDRENRLKNICMNFVIDIRDRKKRPKLSDFMAVYKSQKNEPDAKVKFQKKMKMLYTNDLDNDN